MKLSVEALDTDACIWFVDCGDGKGFVPLGVNKADYTIEGAKLSENGYRYACHVRRPRWRFPCAEGAHKSKIR